MGLFSSSSKSSNYTSTETTQIDNRTSAGNYGDGLNVAGNRGITDIQILDQGAIKSAFGLGDTALVGAFDNASESMQQMNDALGATYGFAEDFADKVLEAGYYSQDKAGDVLSVADNMASQAFAQVDKISQSETANEIQTLGRYGAMLLGLAIAGMVVARMRK